MRGLFIFFFWILLHLRQIRSRLWTVHIITIRNNKHIFKLEKTILLQVTNMQIWTDAFRQKFKQKMMIIKMFFYLQI